MQKILFVLIALIGLLFMSSCNSAKNPTRALRHLSFLEGTWVNVEEGVTLKEHWERKNGELVGYSLLALPKDTLFIENISIFNENGIVVYRSTTGKYVKKETKREELTRSNKHTALFGNRNKLDTKYIFYQKRGDRLILEVRDLIDGELVQDRYFLKKEE